MISVIIPTLNAERDLAATLTALVPAAVDGLIREVIIADGGSTDRTRKIADWAGADLVECQSGRGSQLAAGDLGQKLQNVVDSLPPGPVVIIGTDIPGIRARDIAAAFDKLGSHDAVFGPASDGGYWLVGFRRRPATPRAFHGVRWSGPHALSDTKKNLNGHSVAEIATLDDTDTADDLARLTRFIGRRILPA